MHEPRIYQEMKNTFMCFSVRPSVPLSKIRSGRICRGELTAQWRADQFFGKKLAQLKAARRVNHMDVIHDNPDLITCDNSAEALLANIQAEREKLSSKKAMKKKSTAKKTTKS